MIRVSRILNLVDVHCDSAGEFLSLLSPIDGSFRHEPALELFVFRGVCDAQLSLLPAAFRPDVRLLADNVNWNPGPLKLAVDQCRAEFLTLRRFFDIAARNGVRLPEDTQYLRQGFDRAWVRLLSPPFVWPPVELLSLLGLAQHVGIPTRALDWTWDPLVAAYFAARGAEDANPNGDMCVWVVSYLSEQVERHMFDVPPSDHPIRLFTASGSDNDNLRVQKGLFMIWVQTVSDPQRPFRALPYDEAYVYGRIPLVVAFTRVRVATVHAVAVRRVLAAAGFGSAALFPGLWGVAREFYEEQRARYKDIVQPTPVAAVVHEQIHELIRTILRERSSHETGA